MPLWVPDVQLLPVRLLDFLFCYVTLIYGAVRCLLFDLLFSRFYVCSGPCIGCRSRSSCPAVTVRARCLATFGLPTTRIYRFCIVISPPHRATTVFLLHAGSRLRCYVARCGAFCPPLFTQMGCCYLLVLTVLFLFWFDLECRCCCELYLGYHTAVYAVQNPGAKWYSAILIPVLILLRCRSWRCTLIHISFHSITYQFVRCLICWWWSAWCYYDCCDLGVTLLFSIVFWPIVRDLMTGIIRPIVVMSVVFYCWFIATIVIYIGIDTMVFCSDDLVHLILLFLRSISLIDTIVGDCCSLDLFVHCCCCFWKLLLMMSDFTLRLPLFDCCDDSIRPGIDTVEVFWCWWYCDIIWLASPSQPLLQAPALLCDDGNALWCGGCCLAQPMQPSPAPASQPSPSLATAPAAAFGSATCSLGSTDVEVEAAWLLMTFWLLYWSSNLMIVVTVGTVFLMMSSDFGAVSCGTLFCGLVHSAGIIWRLFQTTQRDYDTTWRGITFEGPFVVTPPLIPFYHHYLLLVPVPIATALCDWHCHLPHLLFPANTINLQLLLF